MIGRCGDAGGTNKAGEPCGTITGGKRCWRHPEGGEIDPQKRLFSEREITEIERMAGIPLTHAEIAAVLDVSEGLLRTRMQDQPGVRDAYKRGKAKGDAFVKTKLREKIKQGDRASIFFYLKTQCGWRETAGLEISGPEGGPIRHEVDVSKLEQEELSTLEQLLRRARVTAN